MPDVEKVISELFKFREEMRTCNSTTYVIASKKVRRMDLIDKTISLLQAQEPRVMTDTELEAIRKAPLILKPNVDAAPHGRWEERRVDCLEETTIDAWQSAKCTNCGKYHTTPYLYYFTDYKFCPNCGAKMDGERRDGE